MNKTGIYISEKVRNSSNTVINPSTEEWVQDIVTAVTGLSSALPLPTWAATSAKQDTIISHVDWIEWQLTTLNAKDFSTSAKQDTIIWHVDGIEWALTTLNAKDFATTAKQDTWNNLIDAVYELIARLDFLPSIRGVASDIRVTTTWWTIGTVTTCSTVTTVTTVSTLTNQTNIGWIPANVQIPSLMNTNVYLNNISNITIS